MVWRTTGGAAARGGVGRALLLIHPGSVTDMLGLAIGVPIYLWQRWRYRVPAKT